MKKPHFRQPNHTQQNILEKVELRLLDRENQAECDLYGQLMTKHHYLHSDNLVGEQLRYVAYAEDRLVALLSWSAAAKHLRWRDEWIGWNPEQLRRRRSLIANNSRFLILPDVDCPNLATRVLGLCCQRLSQDWQHSYGHGILVVESFVDSQIFRGTCYKAQGWEQLGETRGFERKSQDYFVAHDRPKQLWVKQLHPHACLQLRSEILPPELQPTEDKIVPQPQVPIGEMRTLWERCRQVSDWRKRKGRDYPLSCVLSIIVMACFCGVVRGQRDLAAFASKFTQRQLRALRSYKRRDGTYDYPKETTFQRVLAGVDPVVFERILKEWSDEILVPLKEGEDGCIAIDGKAQCGSTPNVRKEQKPQIVSAQNIADGRVLGSVLVEEKSNEIPAARQLLDKLGDLTGKIVMFDALHTNQTTLRKVIQDNGADYLIPVKGNHEGLEKNVKALFAPPPVVPDFGQPTTATESSVSGFPPSGQIETLSGKKQFATAETVDKNNRSRYEIRKLRWTETTPESLCCVGARSVIEITRETTFLEGKRKGEKTYQKVFYICSRILDQTKAAQMLKTIRQYWEIEGALHQRLDVTAKEDESRVRNRNALLTLGIVRRCMMSLYCKWRVKMKKKRNTTLNGYYDIMNTFNNQRAFRLIRS